MKVLGPKRVIFSMFVLSLGVLKPFIARDAAKLNKGKSLFYKQTDWIGFVQGQL